MMDFPDGIGENMEYELDMGEFEVMTEYIENLLRIFQPFFRRLYESLNFRGGSKTVFNFNKAAVNRAVKYCLFGEANYYNLLFHIVIKKKDSQKKLKSCLDFDTFLHLRPFLDFKSKFDIIETELMALAKQYDFKLDLLEGDGHRKEYMLLFSRKPTIFKTE